MLSQDVYNSTLYMSVVVVRLHFLFNLLPELCKNKSTNNKPNFIKQKSTFKYELRLMIGLLFCWYKQNSN